MSFQTNTTISLIASALMFLTKNTLCSNAQGVNPQNNPDLQNSSQANQEDESLADILKNMMLSENKVLEDEMKVSETQIKEINEEYKKLQNHTETEKSRYEFLKLVLETAITFGKDVLKLKKDFTKENYEQFLNDVDDAAEKLKNHQSKYSSVLTDVGKKDISEKIKKLQEIPEKSEEIFTVGVAGSEEKEKIINIIKEVNKSRKNKRLLKKVLIWGGIVLVVVLLVILVIVIYKRRGD